MPMYQIGGKTILFSHVPKTGGTSLRTAMLSMGAKEALFSSKFNSLYGLCNPQHFHADILQDIITHEFCDYVFMFVRNPFDRIVSEYRMLRGRNRVSGTFNWWVGNVLSGYSKNPFMLDNHIRPQSEFRIPGSVYFRCEDGLDTALKQVLASVDYTGEVPEIPFANRSKFRAVNASDETWRSIAKFYVEDFFEFGYPLVPPSELPAPPQSTELTEEPS